MTSLAQRSREAEAMDAEDLPAETLAAVLHDLAAVNRLTLSARPTLDFVRRAIGDAKTFSLLDIGFGEGDMLRAVADWAAKRGIAATLVGVDLNPNAAPAARAATPADLPIDYRTGDYADQPETFDLIVSSFVAHHMSDEQLDRYLRFSDAAAARGWFVNDLHRHRFAYAGFPLLATLMRWHGIVKADGTLSIARAFRPAEWDAILARAGIAGAKVVRRFPFRLCVERIK